MHMAKCVTAAATAFLLGLIAGAGMGAWGHRVTQLPCGHREDIIGVLGGRTHDCKRTYVATALRIAAAAEALYEAQHGEQPDYVMTLAPVPLETALEGFGDVMKSYDYDVYLCRTSRGVLALAVSPGDTPIFVDAAGVSAHSIMMCEVPLPTRSGP